jgi:hypothetical protein
MDSSTDRDSGFALARPVQAFMRKRAGNCLARSARQLPGQKRTFSKWALRIHCPTKLLVSPSTVIANRAQVHFLDNTLVRFASQTLTGVAMNRSVSATRGHLKRQLVQGKPLTGELLEFALGCMNDSSGHELLDDICRKLRSGDQLTEYESHIFVDVILLHVRLNAAYATSLERTPSPLAAARPLMSSMDGGQRVTWTGRGRMTAVWYRKDLAA